MIIREGNTKIFVPRDINIKKKGPLHKTPCFYNPALETDRDICVLFCLYIIDLGYDKFLDGMAATGVRGIRIANEAGGRVYINDWGEKQYKIIQKNIKLNNISACIYKKDLRILLLEKHNFDYIDIDPFGSPIPFIDSAIQGSKRDSFMAFTATDKATLCGVYPLVCKRRYDAIPFHGDAMKEIGLRILIGCIARQTTRFEYGITPLLSYSTDHYFRTYIKISKGIKNANETLKNMGGAQKEQGTWRTGKNISSIGPLWIGNIGDKNIIKELIKRAQTKKLGKRWELDLILKNLELETDAPPLYYESDKIASKLHTCQPKMSDILQALRDNGFHAYKTHFSQKGIKTDAPYSHIKKIFIDQKKLS